MSKTLALTVIGLALVAKAAAANEMVIHDFIALPQGANPQSNLIADAAGDLYGTTAGGGTYGLGTVFMLVPDPDSTWKESVLYSFMGGSDGAYPLANLVFDHAGNLYGTTSVGGNTACDYNSCGVVFRLSRAEGGWKETVLHRFAGGPNDGEYPVAGLVIDISGNLYGTTESGTGTVFELSPSHDGVWHEKILQNFTGGSDGDNPISGLTLDSAGNLYGTTWLGGDVNCDGGNKDGSCGTVFKLTKNENGDWTETILHAFTFADGHYPVGNLLLDSAGNLYGTTSEGPQFSEPCGGCGTVFRLAPNSDGSWTMTTIYSFKGGTDGNQPRSGLTLGPEGTLYGTTYLGGGTGGTASCNSCGTVFELTPHSGGTWIETVIHRFGIQQGNGIEPVAGLLLDRQGNLYGTAEYGGKLGGLCSGTYSGCGTVFKLTHVSGNRWDTGLVYAFPPSSHGIWSKAGLTLGGSGNLYGTASAGGTEVCENDASGCGTVFQLQRQLGGWKEVVLHNFNGAGDGGGPAASLIADGAGNLYGTTSYGGTASCVGPFSYCGGTVFELSPTAQGWTENVLHRFRGGQRSNADSDGAYPLAGLLMDSTGSLYGTTGFGGSGSSVCSLEQNGCGTVFRLSPVDGTWKEDRLYTFQGGADGSFPQGALISDEKGNLYGTTCIGGGFGFGTVFKLAPGQNDKWKEIVLHSFQGTNGDGSCPTAGVVADGNGNLFGTTAWGGNYGDACSSAGCGMVFELSPSGGTLWKESVVHTFQGSDGSGPQGALTFDRAGNLYGSALFGEDYNSYSGVVFRLTYGSNGWSEKVLHTFGYGIYGGGSGPNGGLIFDSTGNIYGTTIAGGSDGGGTVFEIFPFDEN
jgi:uncharacterized repeat protein (TIGR03803 family)